MFREIVSWISGLATFGYIAGLIIFYGIAVPAIIRAIARKKNYATFPVIGIILAICCCAIGFMWNAEPYHCSVSYVFIPIYCAIIYSPNLVFLCLLPAKSPLMIRIRNAAAICFVSALVLILTVVASILPYFQSVIAPIFKG